MPAYGTNESDPTGDGSVFDPGNVPIWSERHPEPGPASPPPQQGITDPPIRSGPAAAPTNNNPYFDPSTNITPGKDIPLKGTTLPTAPTTTPTTTVGGDDASILAQIAQWGAMPGADPSLKNDPNYWLGAIKTRGGLNADNLKFWQDASVGPTAFFNNPNRESGNGGPSVSGTGPAPGQGSGTGFADPAYQALNALAQARITSLQQPQSFPQLDTLMQQLQAQQGVNRQRATDLAGQWQQRVGQLQQPLLTQPQVVQQRALAENNLLDSRDAAIANARANQAARGFAPTSGLAQDRQRQIEENASNQQAQIEARLQQANIGTDEARRNEATQLQGLIAQALNGGDASALQMQAQQADLENQLYQTDQQRQTQQLATAQIPVDLTNQGFNNANSSLSSPNSALGSLMPLIQMALGQQSTQFGQANSQAGGLSQILEKLLLGLG